MHMIELQRRANDTLHLIQAIVVEYVSGWLSMSRVQKAVPQLRLSKTPGGKRNHGPRLLFTPHIQAAFAAGGAKTGHPGLWSGRTKHSGGKPSHQS